MSVVSAKAQTMHMADYDTTVEAVMVSGDYCFYSFLIFSLKN